MKIATILLLALFALVPCAPCMAQTPPAASPAGVEGFLATLASGQSSDPDTGILPPAPTFLSILCSSHEDCPTGQLCCYPCGIDGCDFICMEPERKRCPFFP